MTQVHLRQIAYSPETLAAVEPGFLVLDNLANPRPDWYEYGPIRRYLHAHLPESGHADAMDEEAFYGFFSPKFGRKTGFTHAHVVAAVRAAAPRSDVILFSPQPDMGAFFLNVYEQGETFDPGFIAAAQAWLSAAGMPMPLQHLVMDSRHIVFSNYFVARPAFWRAWLAVNESLYARCEGPPSALRDALTFATSYPGAAQRKVFLMERTASLLLATQSHWRSHAVNPFRMAWSASRLSQLPNQAAMSDALKLAHRDFGFPCYMQAFCRLREKLLLKSALA